MQGDYIAETLSDSSSVSPTNSSDISVGDIYVAEYRSFDLDIATSWSLRCLRYLYRIHTYLVVEPKGTVVDKVYSISFDRFIDP